MAEVVIAVRGGEAAKSRLSPMLPPAARARLVEAMLEDMLDAAARTPGVSGLWVVTPTADLAATARRRGARVLDEVGDGGLNGAFRQALVAVRQAEPHAAIALLRAFVRMAEGDGLDPQMLAWMLGLHLTFVVSGVLLVVMDWIAGQAKGH